MGRYMARSIVVCLAAQCCRADRTERGHDDDVPRRGLQRQLGGWHWELVGQEYVDVWSSDAERCRLHHGAGGFHRRPLR